MATIENAVRSVRIRFVCTIFFLFAALLPCNAFGETRSIRMTSDIKIGERDQWNTGADYLRPIEHYELIFNGPGYRVLTFKGNDDTPLHCQHEFIISLPSLNADFSPGFSFFQSLTEYIWGQNFRPCYSRGRMWDWEEILKKKQYFSYKVASDGFSIGPSMEVIPRDTKRFPDLRASGWREKSLYSYLVVVNGFTSENAKNAMPIVDEVYLYPHSASRAFQYGALADRLRSGKEFGFQGSATGISNMSDLRYAIKIADQNKGDEALKLPNYDIPLQTFLTPFSQAHETKKYTTCLKVALIIKWGMELIPEIGSEQEVLDFTKSINSGNIHSSGGIHDNDWPVIFSLLPTKSRAEVFSSATIDTIVAMMQSVVGGVYIDKLWGETTKAENTNKQIALSRDIISATYRLAQLEFQEEIARSLLEIGVGTSPMYIVSSKLRGNREQRIFDLSSCLNDFVSNPLYVSRFR